MKHSELVKKVVKTKVGEKSTLENNPRMPWTGVDESVINETPLLNRYLKSRGINPEFASKDQKVAHSKTTQFKKWMNDHMNDPVTEGITMEPSPTRKRLNVLKHSAKKHNEIRVADGHKKLHEDAGKEILDRHAHHHSEMMKAMKSGDKAKAAHHETELNKAKSDYAAHTAKVSADKPESAIAKDYKDQEKIRGVGHVRDHVETDGNQLDENRVVAAVKKAWKSVSNFDDPSPKYDGQTRRRAVLKQKLATDKKKVSEAKEANYGGGYQSSVLAVKAKAEKKPVDIKSLADRMQASYRRDNEKDKQGKPVKENLEPTAACNQPWDAGNNPEDTVNKKSTAKKVKLLLGGKKGQVKEDMYDHEKEDKPVTGLKKPKVQKQDADDTTKEAPDAAAILKGGKTLTGEPRDTIEIDPMMKQRKQAGMQPEPNKSKKSV